MIFSIITLFPEMFSGVFDHSIIMRARRKKQLTLHLINLRDFGLGKHRTVDDRPYGGGVGMLLRVDVIDRALQYAKMGVEGEKVVLLDPKGTLYTQSLAEEFSRLSHLVLVCGHYEGVDERVTHLVDASISIGNYVLSGGEIPAMVVVESIARLVPGVLKKREATIFESFSKVGERRVLEHPHYTRPRVYKGMKVPDVLLSGDHTEIEQFRHKLLK